MHASGVEVSSPKGRSRNSVVANGFSCAVDPSYHERERERAFTCYSFTHMVYVGDRAEPPPSSDISLCLLSVVAHVTRTQHVWEGRDTTG